MLFRHPYAALEFEIPDEWLLEAGVLLAGELARFVSGPVEQIYSHCQHEVLTVPLQQIVPPRRHPGVQWFHRNRMVPVLAALRAGSPLPPILADRPPGDGAIDYEVRDGLHRYYGAVAMGIERLPLQVVPYFRLV